MDENKTPINIYLDLSKAFDKLNHSILIHKLKIYGINGTAIHLLTYSKVIYQTESNILNMKIIHLIHFS